MNILIFGGIGFIGTNISTYALLKGHRVTCFDNLSRPGVSSNLSLLKKFSNFSFIEGDITKKKDLVINTNNVECIINLAANPSVPKSIKNPLFDFKTNAFGHLRILELAKKNKTPIIFASSNKVYTNKINQYKVIEEKQRYKFSLKKLRKGINENFDTGGVEGFVNSPYGVSKLVAEKYTREYGEMYNIPYIINRMSCIYGLYQQGVEEQGWIDWFLRAKRSGLPIRIFGTGKQVRDVLFGTDLAELYLYQVEHINKINGYTYNVGGGFRKGFNTSILELIDSINDIFPGRQLQPTFEKWRSKDDQKIYISNIDKVVETTGWIPKTKLIDGLRQMWSYYK